MHARGPAFSSAILGGDPMMRLCAVLTLALLLVLSTLAVAMDGPRIERVDPARTPPGGVLVISGTGLGDSRDALSAKLGPEHEALILEIAGDVCRVLVPLDIEVGRYELYLARAGLQSNAVPVEVTIRGKMDFSDELPPPPSLGPERLAILTIESVSVSAECVLVSGTADVPDGAVLQVLLERVDGKIEAIDRAVVTNKRFGAILLTGSHEAGDYVASVYFNLRFQPRTYRETYRKLFPDPRDLARRQVGTDRCTMSLPGAAHRAPR
jgi:hypothetical protein